MKADGGSVKRAISNAAARKAERKRQRRAAEALKEKRKQEAREGRRKKLRKIELSLSMHSFFAKPVPLYDRENAFRYFWKLAGSPLLSPEDLNIGSST